jgi:enoyl-CoA hydratase/carnithine racemase
MTTLFENHGAVELIRFSRPEKKNALTGEMYNLAHQALVTGQARGIKAFVFAGVEGAFTAGNDLLDFLNYQGTEKTPAFNFIRQLALNDIPLVAAVDGLAIGVGTTMLFHCDLVYASARSIFKMPFVDLGLVPEAASSLLAPRLMGLQKASQYIMLGESFNGLEAEKIGMVNAVCEPAQVESKALEMAQKFAAKPQNALQVARKLLRGSKEEITQRMDEESVHFAHALNSHEAKAAFMAFMSKAK